MWFGLELAGPSLKKTGTDGQKSTSISGSIINYSTSIAPSSSSQISAFACLGPLALARVNFRVVVLGVSSPLLARSILASSNGVSDKRRIAMQIY